MNCKSIISIVVLFLSVNLFGQKENTLNNLPVSQLESSKVTDQNELRINLLMSIIGLPELNYERYFSDNMGVGLAVAIPIEKAENLSTRFMFTPFYRLYFGNKKASGFFIEGNMALVGQKEIYSSYNYDNNTSYLTAVYTRSTTNFGFGAAIGGKFLARNGFVGELFLGGGRLFGESISQAYPRIGVCLGKRF